MVGFFFFGFVSFSCHARPISSSTEGPMQTDVTSTFPTLPSCETTGMQTTEVTATQQDNVKQIAALRDDTNEGHIAEHIRGMVAATMANLSPHASGDAQNSAAQWQLWALGVAESLTLGQVAPT